MIFFQKEKIKLIWNCFSNELFFLRLTNVLGMRYFQFFASWTSKIPQIYMFLCGF